MARKNASAKPKLSLARVVREMARTYRDQPRLLLAAALVVFIPLGLVDVLDERFQHPFEEIEPGDINVLEWIELAGATGLHAAIAMLGEVFYAGVIAGAVAAIRHGEDHSLAHIARRLPYGRLIAVDIVLAVAVAVGLVLLVVPGLILLGRLALVAPAVEVEDRGVRAALHRSWDLVRGNTLRVLVLVLPILIFEDVLTSAVQSGAIVPINQSFVGDWLAATVTDLITAPLFALAVVVSFYELRERGEERGAERARAEAVGRPAV